MGYRLCVALVIFIFLLLFLNGSECRKKKSKPVGKCLNRKGKLKCNSKQICVAGKKLCVPYDMSPKCRCKKNKVRGCEDSIGRSRPVVQVPCPSGHTVAGRFYENSVLKKMKVFYNKKRPSKGNSGVHLIHDNASSHNVCKADEACLVKKSGKPCGNRRSRKCKCIWVAPTTPGFTVTPPGLGCFVAVDLIKIFIPFDKRFHNINGLPCKECMCMPRYPTFVDFCRTKPNCNAAVHLFVGK